MPIIQARGSLSSQAYGQFARQAAGGAFIEDVFSTWLYTPTTDFVTNNINNGIDLSNKGGMVWLKARNASTNHQVYDTVRGSSDGNARALHTNTTGVQETTNFDYITPSSSGFSANFASGGGQLTFSGYNYASWTFAKQSKFFDVVTYTGDGSPNRAIAHALASVPGAIFIKRLNAARNWAVYHRGTTAFDYSLRLNTTDAQAQDNYFSAAPDATNFYIDKSPGGDLNVNASGGTYVAYLFAHNAGGFGASGTDNAISCGSFTTDGSGNATVTLGYEPQWVMLKRSSATSDWAMQDTMRGWTASTPTGDQTLYANSSSAENSQVADYWSPTATGFNTTGAMGAGTYIYIAIRRGPMRTPTSGTSVFSPNTTTAAAGTQISTGFPLDWQMVKDDRNGSNGIFAMSRLTGVSTVGSDENGGYLITSSTAAEATSNITRNWNNVGYGLSLSLGGNNSVYWNFRRAPGFFDVVCYTGTGVAGTVNHNLGVVPELMIVKRRDSTGEWKVYTQTTGNGNELVLNSIGSSSATDAWNDTTPTASVFSIGFPIEGVSQTFVAYLFATLSGVSKVGTYTGTGSTVQVDCGFTAGARFVLIKRTDASGAWYVWDSARGIVPGNDPYLLLNSTAAEVTSTDWVDTLATGFEVSNAGSNLVNVNGGVYMFLAIA